MVTWSEGQCGSKLKFVTINSNRNDCALFHWNRVMNKKLTSERLLDMILAAIVGATLGLVLTEAWWLMAAQSGHHSPWIRPDRNLNYVLMATIYSVSMSVVGVGIVGFRFMPKDKPFLD